MFNITKRLQSIEHCLIRQEEHLKEHMRRTEIAEERLELICADIKPLQQHKHHVDGALRLVGLLSLIAGIVVGICAVLGVFC